MFLLLFVHYTQLQFEDNCYSCWATLEILGYLFLFLDKRDKKYQLHAKVNFNAFLDGLFTAIDFLWPI